MLFCAFAGLRSGAQTEKNMRGGGEKGRNKYPTVAQLTLDEERYEGPI